MKRKRIMPIGTTRYVKIGVLVIAVLGAMGCEGDDSSGPTGPTGSVKELANPYDSTMRETYKHIVDSIIRAKPYGWYNDTVAYESFNFDCYRADIIAFDDVDTLFIPPFSPYTEQPFARWDLSFRATDSVVVKYRYDIDTNAVGEWTEYSIDDTVERLLKYEFEYNPVAGYLSDVDWKGNGGNLGWPVVVNNTLFLFAHSGGSLWTDVFKIVDEVPYYHTVSGGN